MKEEKTLFLDETGSQSFAHNSPYFILSGCSITSAHLEEIRHNADNIIFKYWGSSRSYHQKFKKKHITLHAKDIFESNGPFKILKDPKLKRQFWDDIYGQLLSRPDITYFITLIDKKAIKKSFSHWTPERTLDRSYEEVLKAFIHFLIKTKSHGKICSESSADKDKALVNKLSYFQRDSKRVFGGIHLVNEKITSLSLVNKHDNNIGSQIADLMAWTGSNKYAIDKGIRTVEDLRYEEKRLLKMFNTRLKSKDPRYKNNKFIIISK